ncbi:MAG: ABC transporter permease, partial [Bacteroidales bacterium]|nr:ABC transporter permease [Bacteroidales bacterium]
MLISFSEIGSSLKRNKLRTVLTGFSIAWGIFMLIVLLAAGNGLKNGVTSNFADDNVNQITVWAGWTSIPYKGKPKDTRIQMDNSDSLLMANSFPEVDQVVPIYRVGYKQVQTQKFYTSTNINAVIPEYFKMQSVDMIQGR